MLAIKTYGFNLKENYSGIPATLGTSESVLIRGVAGEFVLKSDFSK